MNITKILAELKSERVRIDNVIAAVESLNSTGRRRARPAGVSTHRRNRGRRNMSAAVRRRLSQLMKQRWAQGKMKPKTKAESAKSSNSARSVSAAGRKRIADAAKRRWAAWRRRKKQPVAKAG